MRLALVVLALAATDARALAQPLARSAAAPPPPLAALLRDPADRGVPVALVDGALFIGAPAGVTVEGHDDAPAAPSSAALQDVPGGASANVASAYAINSASASANANAASANAANANANAANANANANGAAANANLAAGSATADAALARALGDIAWASSPPIAARARLRLPAGARVAASAAGAPLVAFVPGGAVLAADLAAPANAAFARWGYLPYLVHVAAAHAAGRPPERFAAWAHAPVPQPRLVAVWLAAVAALAAAVASAFFVARRRARRRGDDHIAAFFARLAAPTPGGGDALWSRPGIARPLGGFFFFISATVLAMGPYLYVTAVLIPSRVQPFPDADGAWAPVEDFATFAWTLADFGMSVAFVKLFAEWRVAQPARALAAAQAWLWWQLCVGLTLLCVGGAFACGVLPHTHLALFSRVVLLRAALQVPGILSFFTNFFSAIQRFDYQLLLDLLEKRLLIVAIPIPFVLYFRAYGHAHPDIGEPFGVILGIASGQYCALAVSCLVGYTLFRRLGLPLGPLVLPTFDRATVGRMLRFGAGVVAGKAPYFLSTTLEFAFISMLLPGYLGWLGIRQMIMTRLVFTVYFVWPFMDSAVPAISEALAAKKHSLSRYYLIRYLQFGNLFGALVIAVLLGAGRPLVLRALPAQWHAVATYLPLACAATVLLPATWLNDAFQRGAGRPGVSSLLIVSEQLLRLALFGLLIPRLGFAGIFVAIVIALALKTTIGWLVSHRLILRVALWPSRTIGAPLAAGGLVYALIAGAAALLPATRAAGIGLFVAAALGAFPLGFFAVGLIGGLDRAALAELSQAAELAGAMRPVARRLAAAAALGSKLHGGRPAPPLAADAQREADEIVAAERAAPSPSMT